MTQNIWETVGFDPEDFEDQEERCYSIRHISYTQLRVMLTEIARQYKQAGNELLPNSVVLCHPYAADADVYIAEPALADEFERQVERMVETNGLPLTGYAKWPGVANPRNGNYEMPPQALGLDIATII